MPTTRKSLKKVLENFQGLRFGSGRLLDSAADSILVVSRLTKTHSGQSPYINLDEAAVHDKLLELPDNCHDARELMLDSNRMETLLWKSVQECTHWAREIPERIIRKLALEITKAAWDHYQKPKRDRRGAPRPYGKLAVAAFRFANDIHAYESHQWEEKDPIKTDFGELRPPTYLPNGKPNMNSKGEPITIPVFPVKNFGVGFGVSPAHASLEYSLTKAEPEAMEDLVRV